MATNVSAKPQLERGTPHERQRQKERQRVILSSYIGNTIEQYDFLMYATASALVFGPVFFTGLDPAMGIVAAYGTFTAGYLARPLGGVILGHFGDRYGRKNVLILSMFIMGLSSTLIGLVPPAAMIGSWGAVILVFLRICQGIALGGEWGGAALMALEHSEQDKRGFAASIMQAGAPTGMVLGTVAMGLASSLPDEDFLSWGWRIPFLFSFVLLILGLIIRSSVSESPVFLEALARADIKKPKVPILEVLRRPRGLILTALGGAAAFGLQIMLASFAVTYAVTQGAQRQDVLYALALASAVGIGFVILGGRVADRLGRRWTMVGGIAGFLISMPLMFSWFATGQIGFIFGGFMVGLAWHGFIFGPLAAFVSEQFGTTSRYSGAGLGYQLATLIGAGFTPTILAAVFASSGSTTPVMLTLVALGAVSAIAILITGESKSNDLNPETDTVPTTALGQAE